MTWPASNVSTTNADASTDSPALFRSDVLDLISKFNQIRSHASSLGISLIAVANANDARIAIGAAAGNGGGAALEAPWSGITDKPSTLAGYGITDGGVTTGRVTAAMAGAAAGAVGTYAIGTLTIGAVSTASEGYEFPGSVLRMSDTKGISLSGSYRSGTWKLMGYLYNSAASSTLMTGLFLRIA